MLITPLLIVKMKKPHLMSNLLYEYHLPKKRKHKWGGLPIWGEKCEGEP